MNEKGEMMEVIKVDITQELMAIEGGSADFFRFTLGGRLVRPEDVVSPYVVEKKRYVVVQQHRDAVRGGNPDHGKQNFLVPVDDIGLFQDLNSISDHLLGKLIDARTEAERRYAIYATENECVRIKRLPWWKRLLKQF